MSTETKIQWTDATWNPLRGCTAVSPGCLNCYAMKQAHRFSGLGKAYEGLTKLTTKGPRWTGKIRLVPEALDEPLRWRKPRRVFVNSMSDLFHEDVPFDFIDQVFAVMALADRHTFQVLTKRPERMAEYCNDARTPFRVARAQDAILVAREIGELKEEVRPIPEFPGYFVSNLGRVLTSSGESKCQQCGAALEPQARKKFCGDKCKSLDYYYRKVGKKERDLNPVLTPLSPDVGEQGHERVTLFRNGERCRELVHRLILGVFAGPPSNGEQGCHRDGNPRNNAIPNLRWGDQSENWQDRKRHGNGHSYGERHTIAAPITWPLPNCWAGTSVEDQERADERIPHLLRTPAAVRFLSCEPLLGPLDLADMVTRDGVGEHHFSALECDVDPEDDADWNGALVNWVIVGGESGPGARPFNVHWALDIIRQCKISGTACFIKQLGARPCRPDGILDHEQFPPESVERAGRGGKYRVSAKRVLTDRKGGNISEWPEALCVREFPTVSVR